MFVASWEQSGDWQVIKYYSISNMQFYRGKGKSWFCIELQITGRLKLICQY